MSRFVEFDSQFPKNKFGKLVGWVNNTTLEEWPVQIGWTLLFRDPLSNEVRRGRLIEKFEMGAIPPIVYVRAEEIKD